MREPPSAAEPASVEQIQISRQSAKPHEQTMEEPMPVDTIPSSLRRINFIPATCPPADADDVAAPILRHVDGR
jgi:hypothetical protein